MGRGRFADELPAASSEPYHNNSSFEGSVRTDNTSARGVGWLVGVGRGADVLSVLLGEVEREMMIRMVRRAAGAAVRTA